MRSLFYIPIAPLMLAGCASSFHAGAPKGQINVVAHRGASAYAPENTLASYRKAIEFGADWFELDCHLTKDQQVVVMHNGSVDDTTNGKGRIADLTLAEVRALDAGSHYNPAFAGERVPLLTEALDLAKANKIGVYIEIKRSTGDDKLIRKFLAVAHGQDRLTPELQASLLRVAEESGQTDPALVRKVIAMVRERHMGHQVVLQSFSHVICFVARTEAPELRTEFLGADDKAHPEIWQEYCRFGALIDVAGFNPGKDSITEDRVKEFHRQGKSVSVWTVDDPADMRRLAAWGVNGIISNKPDLCLKTLKEIGKH